MTASVLVSVIIPVYNVEKYIKKCLGSVIDQQYSNLEILLVNDGTEDNSFQIVKEFEDPRIKILNKLNGGLSDARNFGLKNAVGKYVYFLDSDDWIEPDLISSCLPILEHNHSDIIYFNYFIDSYSENGEHFKTEKSRLRKIVEKDPDILNFVGYAWNKMYRRSFLVSNSLYFNKTLKIYEDIDFNIRCFAKTNYILFVAGTFYHYNNRMVKSLIKSYNRDNVIYFNDVQESLLNYLSEKDYNEELKLKIVAKYILTALRHQLNAVFQYSNFSFKERSKAIVFIMTAFNNVKYINFHQDKSFKTSFLKFLILNKSSFFLNLALTLKK